MHCAVKSPKNDLSDPDFYTEDDNTLNYLRDEDSSQEASRRKVKGGHVDLENAIIQNKNTATKKSKIDMIASTYPSPFPLPNTTRSVSIAPEGNTTPFSSSTTSTVKSQETRNDLFDDIALLNTTKTTTNSLTVTGTMLSQLSTKNDTVQIRGTSSATPISSSRMSNAHRQQLIFPGSSTSTATLLETPSNKATTKILPTTISTSAAIRPDFCSSSHLPLHSQIQQQPLLVVRQQMISFPPMAYSSNPTTRIGGQTIITPQETLASLAQQTIPLLNLQQPTMVVQPKQYLNVFSPSATTSLLMPQQQEPTNMNPFQSLDVIRNQYHGPPLPPDQILPSLISTYDITSTTHPDLPHFCSNADISGQEKKQHM